LVLKAPGTTGGREKAPVSCEEFKKDKEASSENFSSTEGGKNIIKEKTKRRVTKKSDNEATEVRTEKGGLRKGAEH